MGAPITWQNVNGPSLAQASQPLASATQTFNNAFSQLGDALKERQTIEDANWQTTKGNNTNAYLDAVAKYTDPDKLKAAQADPNSDLNALRARFGNQVDANAVRGAADTRLKQTMQQAQDNLLYKHAMTDEATAADVQAFQSARLKGDTAGMDTAMQSYMSKGGRDPSSLLKFADQRDWEINQRGMSLESHQAQMDQAADAIRHNKASEAIQQTQANAAVQSAATQASMAKFQIETGTADRAQAKAAGQAAALENTLRKAGNSYSDGGIWSGNLSDEMMQFMVKSGIGDNQEDRQNILKAINKVSQDGVTITTPDGKRKETIHDLPVSMVKAAIASSHDPLWHVGWNTGYADDAVNNLKQMMSTFVTAKDSAGHDYPTSKLAQDLARYTDATRNSMENAPAIRSQGAPVTSYPKRK